MPVTNSNASLLFSDDFSGNSLDPKWGTAFWWGGRTLPANGEKQIYLDDNSTHIGGTTIGIDPYKVADGVLTLRAERTPANLLDELGGKQYTSGMVNTHDSFSFKFGYMEVRAQMPEGKGLWPALWLLRDNSGKLGEIDLLEMLGDRTDYLFSTIHHSGVKENLVRAHVPDLSNGFHTFGLDWQSDKTSVYVDGKLYGSIATPAALKAQPMYMLANVAVGGTWPGSPDATTKFPADMKIDYVKVWDKMPGHSTDAPSVPAVPTEPDVVATPTHPASPEAPQTPVHAPATPGIDGGTNSAGAGRDLIHGGPGGDALDGLAGSDTIFGGAGNDTIDGGANRDVMLGGTGNDTYIVDAGGERPVERANGGVDSIETDLSAYTLRGYVENLAYSGDHSFHAVGNRLDNTIEGGDGNDRIIGGRGDDTLIGNGGSDTLYGGVGNDVLISGSGSDRLLGAAGADTFVFEKAVGGSTTFVTDFHASGGDKLNVHDLGLANLAQVLANATSDGMGGTTIHAGADTIILQHVAADHLKSGDFVF